MRGIILVGLALSFAVLSVPALAADECGTGASVTCDNSGTPPTNTNSYANGISYTNADQTVTVQPGVVINTAIANGISLSGGGTQSVTFAPGGPPISLTTTGTFPVKGDGILINNADNIDINTVNGSIATAGTITVGIAATSSGSTPATPDRIVTGDITTTGTNAPAITYLNSGGSGNVTIDTTAGTILTTGLGSAGLDVATNNTTSIFDKIVTADVRTAGDFADAINYSGFNVAGVSIDTTAGTVSTAGASAVGINVLGTSTGDLKTADVATSGSSATAISVLAGTSTPSSWMIDTTRGTVATTGDFSAGVNSTLYGDINTRIASGDVTTKGFFAPGIVSAGGSSVSIDTTAGSIVTSGDGAAGVALLGGFPLLPAVGSDLTVTTGPITTSGNASYGIAQFVDSQSPSPASTDLILSQPVNALGSNSGGVVSLQVGVTGPLTIKASANVTAPGQNSVGVAAASFDGPVNVTVGSGATVMGGWSQNDGDLSSAPNAANQNQSGFYSPTLSMTVGGNLPAAGVVVWSGETGQRPAATVVNNGTIGALSDLAITQGVPCGRGHATSSSLSPDEIRNPGLSGQAAKFAEAVLDWIVPSAHAEAMPSSFDCPNVVIPPPFAGITFTSPAPTTNGSVLVTNNGTVNGYVTLWDGAVHTFDNFGTFNMRNFADTDGDAVRDTRGVAISDFGATVTGGRGGGIFNNEAGGVVKPLQVTGAQVTDTTGQYIPTTGSNSRPLDASVYDMAQNPAITQSQFVNVATFTNSGTIDLQNGVVGDVFLITGHASASASAQVNPGVFVSNGGQLLVDVNLNAGIPVGGQTNSISDVLVVDSTRRGARGATRIYVANVGGVGATTPGNGIEVVEVRDKAAGASAPGVFALGAAVEIGAYEYNLYRNGVGGDARDGNWYLRNNGPNGTKPPARSPSTQTVLPYPDVLNNYAFATLGTLQQRTGNRIWPGQPQAPQTIWCKDPTQNYRCTVSQAEAGVYADAKDRLVIYGQGAWGRIGGEYSSYDPRKGTPYTEGIGFLQAGYEGVAYESASGDLTLGAYATVGTTRADMNLTPDPVTGATRKGHITSMGYGLGVNATWLGNDGFYVDGIGQFTWHDSNLSNKLGSNQGYTTALSLEAGKRFDLGSGWAVVPQAQLVWIHAGFDNFTDIYGAPVKLGDGDSLEGRAGVRVEKLASWQGDDGKPRRLQLYGIANLGYGFLGGTKTKVAGIAFEQEEQNLWGEIGLGATYALADKWSFYGEGDYATSLQDVGNSWRLKGTLGLRYMW
ncbi:autotransporter [Labrys miyagiensis]|uniref:Autotransporter n=1 Tax=Labrys miyagiensis TaxID=346912 RepID=A0ABQ6CIX9_9HYPH|nr:autotransporter outer membrane beta-barrel domain-containing protein [Labrys miyagiensis]GLS20321.1 autotransporter [Labrys miyagiensis]